MRRGQKDGFFCCCPASIESSKLNLHRLTHLIFRPKHKYSWYLSFMDGKTEGRGKMVICLRVH